MFRKKKQQQNTQNTSIILGMIMLQEEHSFSLDALVADFTDNNNIEIEKVTGDSAAAVLSIAGHQVAIGHMPVPIPAGDIKSTASYAYNWVDVLQEISEHKSHLIVSVMGGSEDKKQRFKLFTQVVCSLLRITNALGVYMGNQSLLIPKEDYLSEAAFMNEESLPLNLWVYFGLRIYDTGNSGYTYGLKAFGKSEIEVLNSSQSLEAIRQLLYNIAHYVLKHDVTFEDGQTCGLSEEQRIAITFSKGNQVEGESFKLFY